MVVVYLAFRWLFYQPFEYAFLDAYIGFTCLANWWRAFHLPGIAYMNHTWSLAMVEQFYLLWPMIFALLVRHFGIRWRRVLVIATGAVIISWRIYLTSTDPPYWRLYNGLDTRSDAR